MEYRQARRIERGGFTLVETMTVVVIIGILAAIAIPTFLDYVRRTKTSEAGHQLKSLFSGAAVYYDAEHWTQGTLEAGEAAAAATNCTTGSASTSNAPTPGKVALVWQSESVSFRALSFAPSDPLYYQYEIAAAAEACGRPALTTEVYTFRARGDLDGDGAFSTFELAAGASGANTLYRAPGIYKNDPLE